MYVCMYFHSPPIWHWKIINIYYTNRNTYPQAQRATKGEWAAFHWEGIKETRRGSALQSIKKTVLTTLQDIYNRSS